jgi:DNA gyrase subunit A
MTVDIIRSQDIQVNIEDEMRKSYLDYAMSVIVARALPDARDGLKPVHRRILYAMHDMGLSAEQILQKIRPRRRRVIGKYHPHGDQSVYDAMVRMAQDFSMRYLLVDGQGNFGSIDGDPPPPCATPKPASPPSGKSCWPTSKKRPSNSSPTTMIR